MNLIQKNNLSHTVIISIVVLAGFFLLATRPEAQVQSSEVEVSGLPEKYTIGGKIYPQFWRAELKEQTAFVPLGKIVSIGVQDYEVVGGGHVHELSIAMEAHVMMRIYAVEKPTLLKVAQSKVGEKPAVAEGMVGNVSPVTNLQTNSVVKHYPATTHQPIMEFRVASRDDIDKMYTELEKAYVDFQMRELTDEQRKDAVRTSGAK